jgi:hypothetical protein
VTEIPYLAAVVLIPALRPLNIERTPSLRQAFPGLLATSGSVRLLTSPRVGFSSSELYRPYLPEQDRPLSAQDAIRSPRVMPPSVRPCRPHTRLIPPGLLWVPFPPYTAESGLQGFAPTGSPGFNSLGCGLVVCLRPFGFCLAADTLPLLAMVRTQMDQQVFHLQERATTGRTV